MALSSTDNEPIGDLICWSCMKKFGVHGANHEIYTLGECCKEKEIRGND